MSITVYTKPGCVQCVQTKKMLERSGHQFEIIDVTRDAKALQSLRDEGWLSLPVVKAGSESWAGFHPDKIGAI